MTITCVTKSHSVYAIMKSLTQWCQKWSDGLVNLMRFSTRSAHLILPVRVYYLLNCYLNWLTVSSTPEVEHRSPGVTNSGCKKYVLQTRPKTTLLMYAQLSAMSCAFPDLLALFKLALTVPVASASAERSFSAMRRIKTYLRASMSANRTSDLTVLSVERQLSSRIMEDPSSTITAFAHT